MGNAQSTDQSVAEDKPMNYYAPPPSTAVKKRVIRKTTNNRQPQPYTGAFFNNHMIEPVPHQHVRKPNRSAGHVNFFEVAAVTKQPASVKSGSNSSNSSLKTASKKSYPSTYNSSQHHLKKLSSTNSSGNNSQTSSTASTAVGVDNDKKPPLLKEDPNYIYLEGRRYWKGHGSQNFILPCDDDENDRLMTMHYILKSAFHGNFIAPIAGLLDSEENTKVLDLGCGSGTWILEMATEFPNTDFYGIDDCPLFPTSIKPANSHFKLHDVLKGLPYEDNQFDFVYMRLMILYFTPEELSNLLAEISRVMKPGGFFEVVDTSYTIRHAGPISNRVVNQDLKAIIYNAQNMSVSNYESNTNHPIFSMMLAPNQSTNFFIGNFVDICQEQSMLPLGGWGGGQIGDLHGKNFNSLLSAITCKKAPEPSSDVSLDEKMGKLNLEPTVLPLSKNTVISILDECERYKSYLDWFVCYARKPLDDDQLEQSTLDSIYEFVDGFVDV